MPSYQEKKAFYDRVITIYGRKPVLEALQDKSLPIHRLHLADSNKPTGIVADMLQLAQKRHIDVVYHSKQALSRISRNGWRLILPVRGTTILAPSKTRQWMPSYSLWMASPIHKT
jgi:uncharacterized protein (DUF2235 family)